MSITSFNKAQNAIDQRKYKKAFKIYLRSVKNKEIECELNLGYFYDNGIGVRKNKKKAAYHYKRCADRGDPSGANNLAILYKEKCRYSLAEKYFNIAINLGDKDAALEIAKIFIKQGKLKSAKKYLSIVLEAKSHEVTPASRKSASNMLKKMINNKDYIKISQRFIYSATD